MLSGFVAAIPVITRAFLFIVKPVELGVTKGWYLNTGFNAGHIVSILLFLLILSLGVFRRRFAIVPVVDVADEARQHDDQNERRPQLSHRSRLRHHVKMPAARTRAGTIASDIQVMTFI